MLLDEVGEIVCSPPHKLKDQVWVTVVKVKKFSFKLDTFVTSNIF